MKPGAVLFNSSRGPVADGAAIRRVLDDGHLRACVLDVWEGEPRPDGALLERVFIGTPHIAGYSFDGKVNGTRQIYEAACAFLGCRPDWDPDPLLPAPECPEVTVRGDDPMAVTKAVRAVYNIMGDDGRMRGILDVPEEERGAFFDRLRKEYPRRREFFNTRAVIAPFDASVAQTLNGLGFQIKET
jgi:erythronate-4-phosphate dehydrogenase